MRQGQDIQCPTMVIDAVAAIAALACLAGCAWVILVRGDETRTELTELRSAMAVASRDLAALEQVGNRQRSELDLKRQELAAKGHLPSETPLEEYFKTLAAIAGHQGVDVIRHQPLAVRTYSGLVERRFAYEVSGPFEALMGFLYGIEQTRFWADVSYFRMQTQAAGTRKSKDRTALLTLSIFSASDDAPDANRG